MKARISGKRSEEHTSELQSRGHLVCRLLLEKKNTAASKTRPRLIIIALMLSVCLRVLFWAWASLPSAKSINNLSSFFFNDTATTEIYTLSLHDALPIFAHNMAILGALSLLQGLSNSAGQ